MISGYYGFGNAGDEAILASMVQQFQKEIPDVEIIVLSEDPEKTHKEHGVEAISRKNFWRIFWMLGKVDLFVSGGGGLIQDTTGFNTVLYYLGMIQLARIRGCRVMCYAHGFGPLKMTKSRKLARFVMNQSQVITFRDEKSKLTAGGFGINKPPIYITADPVFALTPAPDSQLEQYIEKLRIHPSSFNMGVSLRPWSSGVNYMEVVAAVSDRMIEQLNAKVYIFPFQHSQDMDISRDLQKKMKNRSAVVLVEEPLPVTVLTGLMGKMDMILGMRLHSLIFAASAGVPAVGISYDPKVSSIMEQVGLTWLDVNHVDIGNLWSACRHSCKNREMVIQGMKPAVDELKKKAQDNTRYLVNLLKHFSKAEWK